MLWYGKMNQNNIRKAYKHQNYNCNVATKTLAFSCPKKQSLHYMNTLIYIPINWEFILLTQKSLKKNFNIIYLISDLYFFKFPVINQYSKFYYDNQTRTIDFILPYTPNFYQFYWKLLKDIFYSFNKIFFLKLKFKGKGYYIYKNLRNTVTTQFGHSHRIYLYSYFLSVKFLSKTTVFLFGFSKTDILKIGYSIQQSKPINIFTGRGVRFSKQIIYKKTGKVSTHR